MKAHHVAGLLAHDHGSPTPHTTTAARAWDQSARGWVWVRAWCEKETT